MICSPLNPKTDFRINYVLTYYVTKRSENKKNVTAFRECNSIFYRVILLLIPIGFPDTSRIGLKIDHIGIH